MAAINITLDSRSPKKTGERRISIVINHKGAKAYVALGLFAMPEQWDSTGRCVRPSVRGAKGINAIITRQLVAARDAVFASTGRGFIR